MTPEYRVEWTRDGEPIPEGPGYLRSGIELELTYPLDRDSGNMICTVTNQAGSDSYLFRFNVMCEYR